MTMRLKMVGPPRIVSDVEIEKSDSKDEEHKSLSRTIEVQLDGAPDADWKACFILTPVGQRKDIMMREKTITAKVFTDSCRQDWENEARSLKRELEAGIEQANQCCEQKTLKKEAALKERLEKDRQLKDLNAKSRDEINAGFNTDGQGNKT